MCSRRAVEQAGWGASDGGAQAGRQASHQASRVDRGSKRACPKVLKVLRFSCLEALARGRA
eukprot:2640551-Alexandrium_andersonii.AAC.1